MAVTLSINYTKKLGLPQFSSHCCSVSVQVEVSDLSQVAAESSRLYTLLQTSVDAEIQKVGFMPDTTYGIGDSNGLAPRNGAHVNNGTSTRANGTHGTNGTNGHRTQRLDGQWNCTDGQRGLILRVVNEHQLDKAEIEAMAQQLFRVGVKECNKMQASQLIEELLEKVGKQSNSRGSRWRNPPARS